MPYLSKSESGTSKSRWTYATIADSRVEWEEIRMDFIIGLPLTPKKKDMICVIMDRLTKSAHFLAANQKDSREKLVNLYVQEIVSKHRVPKTIVSDRGSVFTSAFWKQLHEALGYKLDFSTAYHP
jgi:hypothetical protein